MVQHGDVLPDLQCKLELDPTVIQPRKSHSNHPAIEIDLLEKPVYSSNVPIRP
jgi:hypothetical protein